MSSNLEQLINWFPSGTAEGERAILERVFVYVSELKRLLSPPPGNPLLLIGRKGTGKSAIIDFAVKLLDEQKIPAIMLQPRDIPTSDLTDADSLGDVERKFHGIILGAIAAKLSEDRTGLLRGDDAKLYDEAVRAGHRSPDVVGKIARSLPSIAKPFVSADFTSTLPTLNTASRREIETAIANRVVEKRFHIFVDDTDQIANPEKPGHLNRIWGLLLAIRELSSRIPEICAVITLREEVWERLKREQAGQRDQTDHFSSLIVPVSSSDDHVARIVEVRLRQASERCDPNEGLYPTFFDGPGARAPLSPDFRSWRDLIVVRSRKRPRDAIQLVNALADHALNRAGKPKIDEATFRSVMPRFSEERANLFAQEVEAEFPQALDVLRSFALADYEQGGFRLTADQTRDHLRKVSSQFGITIHGRTIRPERENDVFDVWRFLYQSNVLNARVSDSRAKDGYRHVQSSAEPDLVSKARWNEMQSMLWEINPAFRDYLVSRQADHEAKTGLPVRKKRSRRQH